MFFYQKVQARKLKTERNLKEKRIFHFFSFFEGLFFMFFNYELLILWRCFFCWFFFWGWGIFFSFIILRFFWQFFFGGIFYFFGYFLFKVFVNFFWTFLYHIFLWIFLCFFRSLFRMDKCIAYKFSFFFCGQCIKESYFFLANFENFHRYKN